MNKATPSKKDIKAIANELMLSFEETLFNPLREISDMQIVENSSYDTIQRELDSGKIEYVGGVLKGAFSLNAIKFLENIGSEYSGLKKGYIVKDPKMLVMIGTATSRFMTTKEIIQKYIEGIDKIQLGLKEQPFDNVIEDVTSKASKNIDEKKIVNQEMIKKDFFDTTNKSGVAFIELLLIKLGKDLVESKSRMQLSKAFDIRYGQAKRKTMVLADEGSFYFGGQARRRFYQINGIKMFRWVTKGDVKVRDSHRHLNGEEFSYDDPPIVDGKQLLPGEDYGCRCVDFPIKPKPKKVK